MSEPKVELLPLSYVTRQEYINICSGTMAMIDLGRNPSTINVKNAVRKALCGTQRALEELGVEVDTQ